MSSRAWLGRRLVVTTLKHTHKHTERQSEDGPTDGDGRPRADPPMLSAIWLTTSAMFPERSVDSSSPKLGESGSAGGAADSGSATQHTRTRSYSGLPEDTLG